MKKVLLTAVIFLSFICVLPRYAAAVEKTGYADMFSLDGSSERFVLLESDDEGYFVITQKLYGTHLYDANDRSKFDVTNPANMAYWLNNEFLTEGNNGKKLPGKIIEHLVERDYFVEESSPQSQYSEAYNVRAKVALLSSTEFDKYNSIFGYADDVSEPYWFLRSSSLTSTNVNGAVMVSYTSEFLKTAGKNFRYYAVRPVFYLDKDFFKEVKLNLSNAYFGDNIKKLIRSELTKKELAALYTEDELETIFNSPLKPVASDVLVKGFPVSGSTLTATYKFYSPDGEKDAGSIIRWVKSKNKDFGYRAIAGAKGESYTLTDADAGYYVKAEVIPKTKMQLGFAVSSPAPKSMVFPNYMPVASSVMLEGAPCVGARLVLGYNYSDGNYDKERGTVVEWERSKDGVNFEKISNADGVNYTVNASDAGFAIRCKITVRNNEGSGDSVYSNITAPVFEKPAAVNLSIKQGNGYAEAEYSLQSGATEENSAIHWEFSESADGDFITLAESSNRLDTAFTGGKYIRFFVAPSDKDGHKGDIAYSPAVFITGESSASILSEKEESISAEMGDSLYTGTLTAPAVIILETENSGDCLIESGGMYDMYKTMTAQKTTYTFVLKNGEAAQGSIKLCDVQENTLFTNIRAVMYDGSKASTMGNYVLKLERR